MTKNNILILTLLASLLLISRVVIPQSVPEALETLERFEKKNNLQGQCHVRAHQIGISAFEKFGARTFALCNEKCGGGCYHGAIGAFTEKFGAEKIDEALKTACQDSDIKDQCWHGVGHGILAWHNYELFNALKSCENTADDDWHKEECWRGVFMENVVGTFASHRPPDSFKYLSEADPSFPCTAVPAKYKNACWQFVVFRLGALYGDNFKEIADGCAKVPFPYNQACFSSVKSNAAKKL